jgi:hypothetical protein
MKYPIARVEKGEVTEWMQIMEIGVQWEIN